MLASQNTGEPVNNMATANIAKTQKHTLHAENHIICTESKHEEEEAQPFPQNSSQKPNNFRLREGNH